MRGPVWLGSRRRPGTRGRRGRLDAVLPVAQLARSGNPMTARPTIVAPDAAGSGPGRAPSCSNLDQPLDDAALRPRGQMAQHADEGGGRQAAAPRVRRRATARLAARGQRPPAPHGRLSRTVSRVPRAMQGGGAPKAGQALLALVACHDMTTPLAGILVVRHGQVRHLLCRRDVARRASRSTRHHLLLWSAIGRLRDEGCTHLGSRRYRHRASNPGIARFKLGLGGAPADLGRQLPAALALAVEPIEQPSLPQKRRGRACAQPLHP